ADAVSYTFNYDAATYQERARTIIARLKASGVTTVIDGGDVIFNVILTKEATSQAWFPEWFEAGNAADVDSIAKLNDPQQWKNAFGVSILSPIPDQPDTAKWFFNWYWGSQAANRSYSVEILSLALLMDGIQLAGPHLTPQSFRAGMFSYPP